MLTKQTMQVLSFGGPRDTSQSVVIFLHGFPSVRSKQNRELAEGVSSRTGFAVFAPLYSGLGCSPGIFSFSSCMDEVRTWLKGFFADLEANHSVHVRPRRVVLIGHSWGGFLSLIFCNEFAKFVEKLILLSPLLRFAPAGLSAQSFSQTALLNPQLQLPDPEILGRDFAEIGARYSTESLIGGLAPDLPTVLLQAKDDVITPPGLARELVPVFRCPLKFELVNQDHSFLRDRPELIEKLSQLIPHRAAWALP